MMWFWGPVPSMVCNWWTTPYDDRGTSHHGEVGLIRSPKTETKDFLIYLEIFLKIDLKASFTGYLVRFWETEKAKHCNVCSRVAAPCLLILLNSMNCSRKWKVRRHAWSNTSREGEVGVIKYGYKLETMAIIMVKQNYFIQHLQNVIHIHSLDVLEQW